MKSAKFLLSGVLALVFAGFIGTATAADECSIEIDSTDAMKFDTDVIVVKKSCEQFTVKLTHSGKLQETVMGHNWVLTTADDVQAVAKDGMSAGLQNEYVKPDDKRVIAHTDIIGGGEETSVTFAVNKLNSDTVYTFFCSFPGHYAVMRGTLSLK